MFWAQSACKFFTLLPVESLENKRFTNLTETSQIYHHVSSSEILPSYLESPSHILLQCLFLLFVSAFWIVIFPGPPPSVPVLVGVCPLPAPKWSEEVHRMQVTVDQILNYFSLL